MNILITLPKELLDKIISGEKKFEMRKTLPRLMEIGRDGFFVVEKGTNEVKCWCMVSEVVTVKMNEKVAQQYAKELCVTPEYICKYATKGTELYLWKIGKVNILEDLVRNSLGINKNPQQFAYCPLSYGESY